MVFHIEIYKYINSVSVCTNVLLSMYITSFTNQHRIDRLFIKTKAMLLSLRLWLSVKDRRWRLIVHILKQDCNKRGARREKGKGN